MIELLMFYGSRLIGITLISISFEIIILEPPDIL